MPSINQISIGLLSSNEIEHATTFERANGILYCLSISRFMVNSMAPGMPGLVRRKRSYAILVRCQPSLVFRAVAAPHVVSPAQRGISARSNAMAPCWRRSGGPSRPVSGEPLQAPDSRVRPDVGARRYAWNSRSNPSWWRWAPERGMRARRDCMDFGKRNAREGWRALPAAERDHMRSLMTEKPSAALQPHSRP